MKKTQKSKASVKPDQSLSVFPDESGYFSNDSSDRLGMTTEGDSNAGRKNNSNYKFISQVYATLVSQIVPVVYKAAYDAVNSVKGNAIQSEA